MLKQRLVNFEYKKWLTKLLGFDFDIENKPALENKAVNTLSLEEVAATLIALSIPSTIQMEQVIEAVKEDQVQGKIMSTLRMNSSTYPGCTLVRGALLYKGLIALS